MDADRDDRTGLPPPLEAARRALAAVAAKGDGAPVKHSVTIRGHATSISLEPPFRDALKRIAMAHGIPLARLVAEIDAVRGPLNLSSALRVFVLFSRSGRDEGSGAPARAGAGGNAAPPSGG